MTKFQIRRKSGKAASKAIIFAVRRLKFGVTNLTSSPSILSIRRNGWNTLVILSLTTVGVVFFNYETGAAQAAMINTISSWNGRRSARPFGERNTATYGQTFTVGADNILDNFTFFLQNKSGPDAVDFAAYVMAWNGAKATGSKLYESTQRSTDLNVPGMQKFTFKTGGINLTPGAQYVAFLSASDFFDGIRGKAKMGYLGRDIYYGGGFVFSNNRSNFKKLKRQKWSHFHGRDAAFKASFSSTKQEVPEPLTILGVITAGGMGLSMGWKKKMQEKDR
ncbi:MAG: PEP-CTERM sorting domain-containing protein [Cyanobacteria bacterium P01_A01_bin.84]